MADPTDTVEVRPRGALDARVRVPGSRSITNRALLVAALADGRSRLGGALESDDTKAMRDGLRLLGIRIEGEAGETWSVLGTGARLHAPERALDVRASGTTARFLTAAAALAPGPVVIDGAPRMRERPIVELVRALGALGAPAEILGARGCPPVRVAGGGLDGGRARIDVRRSSSQYVSAILMVAPYARRTVELELVEGVLISRPYVELTLDVMGAFGAEAGFAGPGLLRVEAGRPYRPRTYRIEPDASSAAYPFTAAAITGGRVRVDGIAADSRQADAGYLAVLERMGCRVVRGREGVEVTGPEGGRLRAVDADMNAMPDAALALAVAALFADGPSRIHNVPNLRIKETDRLAALETELRKLGAGAEAGPDWLRIAPGPLRAAEIEPYDDHRMAMAFALAGLRIAGIRIRNPGCVAKTWPDFFDVLERL